MTPTEVITEAVWSGGGTREAAEDCALLAVEFLSQQGYTIVGPSAAETPPAKYPDWFVEFLADMAEIDRGEHPNG